MCALLSPCLATGLSYTRFRFAVAGPTSLTASTAAMHAAHREYYLRGGGAEVSPLVYTVNVTNIGTVASDVVVLGFLRNPLPPLLDEQHSDEAAEAPPPQKELFNFERLRMLAPGATRQVRLSVPAQVLSLVDGRGTERLRAGQYGVEFGVKGAAEGEVAVGTLRLVGEDRVVFEMPKMPRN